MIDFIANLMNPAPTIPVVVTYTRRVRSQGGRVSSAFETGNVATPVGNAVAFGAGGGVGSRNRSTGTDGLQVPSATTPRTYPGNVTSAMTATPGTAESAFTRI